MLVMKKIIIHGTFFTVTLYLNWFRYNFLSTSQSVTTEIQCSKLSTKTTFKFNLYLCYFWPNTWQRKDQWSKKTVSMSWQAGEMGSEDWRNTAGRCYTGLMFEDQKLNFQFTIYKFIYRHIMMTRSGSGIFS